MRLWSIHPRHLDSRGLVALWREALLARRVLAGKTAGYRRHPQLIRFLSTPSPRTAINVYLRAVHREAVRRGFHFDEGKLEKSAACRKIGVNRGQLAFELHHLRSKLMLRDTRAFDRLASVDFPEPHPLFEPRKGGVEPWEKTDVTAVPGTLVRTGGSGETNRPLDDADATHAAAQPLRKRKSGSLAGTTGSGR